MRNLANINRAESKKRIEFIDLAKGVCILQVTCRIQSAKNASIFRPFRNVF